MSDTDLIPQEEKIKALVELGLTVRPVIKVMVPRNMGTPMRDDGIVEEMDVDEAYRMFTRRSFKDLDPFSR